MEKYRRNILRIFRYGLFLSIAGLLLAVLGLAGSSPVQAQEPQIVFIEGTFPVGEALIGALSSALERSGAAVRISSDYFAVTDVVEKQDWLLVSVVGLSGITDLAHWNIIDHGVWFSSILVQVDEGEFTQAAVYGTADYQILASRTPDSVISPQAKQSLNAPEIQTAAGEDFIFPFPGGYQLHYGSLGLHGGWSMDAVDLGSDGNTALGHAPNYLIASSSGTVTYRCTPGAGQLTTTIKVGEFLYAHLVDSSVSWQISDYVPQGTYLGQLQTGSFNENCGYGSQGDTWFHVHFGFLEDPLILSGWTLVPNTQYPPFTKDAQSWEVGTWQLIGEAPTPPDLIIDDVTFSPVNPTEGQSILATMYVRNAGGAVTSPFTVDLYFDGPPTVCTELGDYSAEISSLGAGESIEVEFTVTGLTAGSHQVDGYVDTNCVIDESGDPTHEDNEFGPEPLVVAAPSEFFVDGFETGDFSQWSRVNLGGGFLTVCEQAAFSGTWGTCVDRGTNDKRKVLIDDTPVDQTRFSVRFNIDLNGFSMPEGTRFRFLETRRGLPRTFFLVLRRLNGQYQVQFNILVDGQIKYKSSWYTLSDAPHTIEIDWQASSAEGADDGAIQMYLDEILLEEMAGLDNDTHIVSSLRIGFIGRLDGSPISGIWFVDDVATSTTGYLGLP
jgi:hypothetical protein